MGNIFPVVVLLLYCCCIVVLRPRQTSKVMSGRSVNLSFWNLKKKIFLLQNMRKMTHPFFHDASILVSVGVFLTHRFETVGVFAHFLCVKNAPYLELWISPDFGGSSRFGAFSPGLTLGRRNLPTRGFSNVIFLGPYFCPNILSFTAGSTWRIICL